MHDNPALYPHLPIRPIDVREREILLDPVIGTEWQTCWEYVLSHRLTDREGSAFWHGANLAYEAMNGEIQRLRGVVARVEAVAQDHAGTIAGEDLRDAIAGDDDE